MENGYGRPSVTQKNMKTDTETETDSMHFYTLNAAL